MKKNDTTKALSAQSKTSFLNFFEEKTLRVLGVFVVKKIQAKP